MRKALIVCVVALCAALSGCGSSGPDELGAKIACKQFVENALKSPASADFPSYSSMEASGGPTSWSVRGYVDSENGFGAQIRTDWTCTVSSYDEGDSWNLEGLSGL